MNRNETFDNFQNLVKNIISDINERNYERMRAGIRVALDFLDFHVTTHSISLTHRSELIDELSNSVFSALTTE